jgi:hypothetical protein
MDGESPDPVAMGSTKRPVDAVLPPETAEAAGAKRARSGGAPEAKGEAAGAPQEAALVSAASTQEVALVGAASSDELSVAAVVSELMRGPRMRMERHYDPESREHRCLVFRSDRRGPVAKLVWTEEDEETAHVKSVFVHESVRGKAPPCVRPTQSVVLSIGRW